MTTIKDIAQALGLSSATVSRTLRNDETLSISPETRTRILTTAEEMGYIRPKRATKAVKDTSKSVLVIHKHQTFRNQIDSSYYFAVRSGIEDVCSKSNMHCTFMPIEELYVPDFSIDGIILIGNFDFAQFTQILDCFSPIPITVIGIVAYYRDKIDQISYKNYDSVLLALNHLFEMGHKDIGYLGINEAPGTELFGTRKEAFKSILKSHTMLNEKWIFEVDHGSDRVEQGYQLMNTILSSKAELPTAFFCANDPIALGAIKALTENGLRVPDDISIVAHDGSFPTQYSFPPLTTVDVHPYQLGIAGVKTLLERIDCPETPPKQILLYPALLIRESVQPLS